MSSARGLHLERPGTPELHLGRPGSMFSARARGYRARARAVAQVHMHLKRLGAAFGLTGTALYRTESTFRLYGGTVYRLLSGLRSPSPAPLPAPSPAPTPSPCQLRPDREQYLLLGRKPMAAFVSNSIFYHKHYINTV